MGISSNNYTDELSEPRQADYYQKPELSQPLITALQLAILSIFEEWDVSPQAVVGHSSGEIAAAYAAGYLSQEQAILAAFYRGQAAAVLGPTIVEPLGMCAVGAGAEQLKELLPEMAKEVQVACVNSPNSVTLSGPKSHLVGVQAQLEAQGTFARLLRVDLAYHSSYVADIAALYKTQLEAEWAKYPAPERSADAAQMFSSVTGHLLDRACDSEYWRVNMASPVLFSGAAAELVQKSGATLLLEVGPSGALAGPVRQILEGISVKGVQYLAALDRGKDGGEAMHELAGKFYIADYPFSLRAVNFPSGMEESTTRPSVLVDLPNYSWDHSAVYWHESDASKDWRFGQFPYHELLGRKILGTPWSAPSWKSIIRLDDMPWLKDHRMAGDPVFPAAGYLAMAIEAVYQARQSVNPIADVAGVTDLQFVLRDVNFRRALALDSGKDTTVVLAFTEVSDDYTSWTGFRVLSLQEGTSVTHCDGRISVRQVAARGRQLHTPLHYNPGNKANDVVEADSETLAPLSYSESASHWYRTLDHRGCTYGPDFQRLLEIECRAGQQETRSTLSRNPPSTGFPQHPYAMHPSTLDICFQSVFPALYSGLRSEIKSLLLPSHLEELTVGPSGGLPTEGETAISVARAGHSGSGSKEKRRNHYTDASVWSAETGKLLLEFKGLRFSELNMGDDKDADPELLVPAWLPDFEFLSQEQILSVLRPESAISDLIDLVAFKKPTLRVGEINLTTDSMSSAWFDGAGKGLRDASEHYTYADPDSARLGAIRSGAGDRPSAEFKLLGKDANAIFPDPGVDLVIVQYQDLVATAQTSVLERIKSSEAKGDVLYLFVQRSTTTSSVEHADETQIQDAGFNTLFKIPIDESSFAYLARSLELATPPPEKEDPQVISIISADPQSELLDPLANSLSDAGYAVQLQTTFGAPTDDVKAVVVLDDFASPVLSDVTDEQWASIRDLVLKAPSTLWVTQGAQHKVTNPNNALITGLARSIRSENPAVRLVTLDVESKSPKDNSVTILQLLDSIASSENRSGDDSEFVERDGILHVSRTLRKADAALLNVKDVEVSAPSAQPLHDNGKHVKLGIANLGSLESLELYEALDEEPPMAADQVEIEVYATGLNYKVKPPYSLLSDSMDLD
jgi:acyl transferase domain-containing protein